MKENRFIELLNLYVDRQITAEQTAELEEEIRGSPRHRAIYRQYCQMHRATKLVYDSFRVHASDQQPATTVGRGSIARFENRQRHRRSRLIYYAGGLAAAACLALVFARLNSGSGPATPAGATADQGRGPVAPIVAAVPAAGAAAAPAERNGPADTRNGLVNLRNASVETDYAAVLLAMRQEEQRAYSNGQIRPGRAPSLFDDGVFDSPQLLPAGNQRVFRGRQSPAPQAEFTAFQFQR